MLGHQATDPVRKVVERIRLHGPGARWSVRDAPERGRQREAGGEEMSSVQGAAPRVGEVTGAPARLHGPIYGIAGSRTTLGEGRGRDSARGATESAAP